MYTQQKYQSTLLPQQKSTIQKLLDDNSQLITLILDLQMKGKQNECLEYHRKLYRNLTYLTQFDLTTSHHSNSLPPPDSFNQTSSSIQQNSIYHQQNLPAKSNTENVSSHQQAMYNNSNELQKIYHPQQNYLMQQQWHNQSRTPIRQQSESS
ncbi:unnamed protein product [Adineta steineri]|uniref:SS18 N-terminal domain-containing protein n=1 Tax=Adineta steineri TaxID=433720 RepID=A0A813YJE4_9BILA|nr:unnamed protein product [Adineta steineri]CAF0885225.1 unnamed protein product [Adineta steineri]